MVCKGVRLVRFVHTTNIPFTLVIQSRVCLAFLLAVYFSGPCLRQVIITGVGQARGGRCVCRVEGRSLSLTDRNTYYSCLRYRCSKLILVIQVNMASWDRVGGINEVRLELCTNALLQSWCNPTAHWNFSILASKHFWARWKLAFGQFARRKKQSCLRNKWLKRASVANGSQPVFDCLFERFFFLNNVSLCQRAWVRGIDVPERDGEEKEGENEREMGREREGRERLRSVRKVSHLKQQICKQCFFNHIPHLQKLRRKSKNWLGRNEM